MRWVLDDGSSREGPWEEPLDAKRPANGTSALCPASKLVWAVPTQEGFALQLNSLVSVLALAYHLKRVAVLMPLLATGPHYRAAVATRRMAPTYRMSAFVDLEKSLRGDAFRGVRYVHFDDVAADVPAEARCVSCAGAPPRHVRCARGWDFGWCDRRQVARTRKAKCAVQFGGGRWARECAFCVFSAGFTPGVQRAEPAWKRLRSRLVFAERFEAGAAACARAVLGGARGGAPVDYVAFHMRRGDKSHTLDRHGLTVAAVLDKVAAIARGRRVIVATDDRSNGTFAAIRARGFGVVDGATLRTHAPAADDPLGAYLVDLLLCVGATTFVGTATRDNKSKQFELIKALRIGRGFDVKRDHLLQNLPPA